MFSSPTNQYVNQPILSPSLHPQVRIGHVHLKVADLERSLAFYGDVLGFEVTQRYGSQAVFLAAGVITITSD
jgi:catechol 2,3-dioxygenase